MKNRKLKQKPENEKEKTGKRKGKTGIKSGRGTRQMKIKIKKEKTGYFYPIISMSL